MNFAKNTEVINAAYREKLFSIGKPIQLLPGKPGSWSFAGNKTAMSSNITTRNKCQNRLQLITGIVLLTLSLIFIYESAHFFNFTPQGLGKYFILKWVIMGHIAGGSLALLLGPFQLWKKFRTRFWKAHRIMGRIYIGAIVVGAACALILASTTAIAVGWPYALSLHVLATVWLVSALLTFITVLKKKMKQHEEWANRSYISTVAFIAQAFTMQLPVMATLGSFAEVSPTIIWFSWTVPMFVYECVRTIKSKK